MSPAVSFFLLMPSESTIKNSRICHQLIQKRDKICKAKNLISHSKKQTIFLNLRRELPLALTFLFLWKFFCLLVVFSSFFHNLSSNKNNLQIIFRIFAEFNPVRCALLSADSGVVRFKTTFEAAEALIYSTKQLIRTRHTDSQEDGELEDADDEDSEGNIVRKEDGDKVLIIKGKRVIINAIA